MYICIICNSYIKINKARGENQLEPKHKMTVFNKTNVNDNKYSKKTSDQFPIEYDTLGN